MLITHKVMQFKDLKVGDLFTTVRPEVVEKGLRCLGCDHPCLDYPIAMKLDLRTSKPTPLVDAGMPVVRVQPQYNSGERDAIIPVEEPGTDFPKGVTGRLITGDELLEIIHAFSNRR